MKKQRFNVTGMSCAACQAAIERTVGKMDGVQSAVVNLLANTLTTEYDETKVTNEAICSRIAQIGYGATPEGAAPEAKTSQEKKAAEEAKKGEAEDVLKKLLANGMTAEEILAKLQ